MCAIIFGRYPRCARIARYVCTGEICKNPEFICPTWPQRCRKIGDHNVRSNRDSADSSDRGAPFYRNDEQIFNGCPLSPRRFLHPYEIAGVQSAVGVLRTCTPVALMRFDFQVGWNFLSHARRSQFDELFTAGSRGKRNSRWTA